VTDHDEQRRGWLDGHLDLAVHQFGVRQVGAAIHSSRLRAVGCHVHDDGDDAWLRVVYEDPEWGEGAYLDGNATAKNIRGVPKPIVKRWKEWDDSGRTLRGEISTFVAEPVVSPHMVPATEPALPNRWLTQLRMALGALAAHPIPEHGVDAEYVNHGLLAYFGISIDLAAVAWTAAHCDLHWGNLTSPNLVILDWETWGRAPAGYDAATLYCASLPYPTLASRVGNALSPFLDTPAGRVATLVAAVRFLRFVDGGEYLALAQPLRHHALDIVQRL
jgi:hypothetical protein